jgi:hypothetical protein
VILYGVCAGPGGKFERIAAPGIERVRDTDDRVLALFDQPSIFVAYNRIIDQARQHADLEALVLIHDDVELLDGQIKSKLLTAFEDESVAVVGVIGAAGVQSLEWWNYETRGRVQEDRLGLIDFGGGEHDVDVVDGLFMAISPWAVFNVRFDENYRGFHGYDGDLCLTVKSQGRRVMVADIRVAHRTQGGYGDKESFDASDRRFQAKWGLTPPRPKRQPSRARRLAHRLMPRKLVQS